MAAPRELTKLPRAIKRSLLLGLAQGFLKDKNHYGELKRAFTQAERHYVDVKNRRPTESAEA